MNRSRSFPRNNMNPELPANAVLSEVRQMIQEMVNQLLPIAERMAALVQSLASVERATPAHGGKGFFAAFDPRASFPGRGHRTVTPDEGFNYQAALGRALRGEYERAERAEGLLAELRGRQVRDTGHQGKKRPQHPSSKYVAKDHRPAKRQQPEQGRSVVSKGKDKETGVGCTICRGPHPSDRCEWREGRCYTCGQWGHRSYTCQGKSTAAPPAPPIPRMDEAKDRRQVPESSLPRDGTAEDDASEEDPIEDDSEEEDPAEDAPDEEDHKEDDPEEEDPVEEAPNEEGPHDNPSAQAGHDELGGEPSDSPRPVVRVFGRGPYNFSADDAQSQNGK